MTGKSLRSVQLLSFFFVCFATVISLVIRLGFLLFGFVVGKSSGQIFQLTACLGFVAADLPSQPANQISLPVVTEVPLGRCRLVGEYSSSDLSPTLFTETLAGFLVFCCCCCCCLFVCLFFVFCCGWLGGGGSGWLVILVTVIVCLFVCLLLCVCFCPPKGGRGCLMSPSCLESQGCHLIPLSYLLACFFCLILLLFLSCHFSVNGPFS